MSDRKKRPPVLSSLDKALMIAYNYTPRIAANVKQFKEETRQRYRALSHNLRISGPPGTPIERTHENAACYDDLFKCNLSMDFATAARCLLLGYWEEHRIVYRVPKDTLLFLDDSLKIEYWNAELRSAIRSACSRPIYIEIEGQGTYHGHFVGLCSLPNIHLPRMKKGDILLSSIAVDEISSFINIAAYGEQTVTDFFDESDGRIASVGATDEQRSLHRQMTKVLLYIGFLNKMLDAQGTAMIRDTSKNYERYTVLPIPFTDSIPNYELPGGWIAGGLCNRFGYLSRQHMQEDFQREIKLNGSEWGKPLEFKEGKLQGSDGVARFIKEAVLRWEAHKTVYQYDRKTEHKLCQKVEEEEMLLSIPSGLGKYMPYDAIVLSRYDDGNICIVAPCLVSSSGTVRRQFLLLNMAGDGRMSFLLLPTDESGPISYNKADFGLPSADVLSAYVVFCHILKVYQKKTQKRLAKELLSQGSPDSTAIMRVEEYLPRSKRDDNGQEDKSIVRVGYSLSDELIDLNDVTARTVKRVPAKDTAQRVGWTMRPHARRAHPHRYWVGKGSERHMEVRLLAEMHINCKEKYTPDTVIHEIA